MNPYSQYSIRNTEYSIDSLLSSSSSMVPLAVIYCQVMGIIKSLLYFPLRSNSSVLGIL